jgi:hypothetical protein
MKKEKEKEKHRKSKSYFSIFNSFQQDFEALYNK